MLHKDSPYVFVISPDDAHQRLDSFLSDKTNLSRSQVQKLIQEGYVLLNGQNTSKNHKINPHEIITLITKEQPQITLKAEPIKIEILYKDDYLVVINKPAGLVVYPSFGHESGTLLNAIYYHTQKLANAGMPLRPGIVHRLDKDTSGVMVVAIDDSSYYGLAEQFAKRLINRRYLSLINGNTTKDCGEIVCPIGRAMSDRKKMSIRTKRGKEAITHWKVIERYKLATLIEARLGTGRTHQIRVHFSAIGHPVLGDTLYGKKTSLQRGHQKVIIPRQMLHAETLGFVHPVTNQYMEFSSLMPEDMQTLIDWLRD